MTPSAKTDFVRLQQMLDHRSAAEVAELFISPWVDRPLLLRATEESGPAMWIVNRSDVYDPTLEKLLEHSLKEIALRAKEKLSRRHSSLDLLDPPEPLEVPIEQVPEREAEDILGHPLCSFEAIMHFSKSLLEDNRGSSALSLTRRLLEHAPNWLGHEDLKEALRARFSEQLIEDPSPFVRSYCARVPLLKESDLSEALKKETHPTVAARLLQNPATSALHLRNVIETQRECWTHPQFQSILAADERLNLEQRKFLQKHLPEDSLASVIHSFFI